MNTVYFTIEEREDFKNVFDSFDENKDNIIETNNIGKLLRAVGYNPTDEEVEDMIEDINSPNLDFNSFLYIVSRHAREVDPEDELIEAFKVFDKEGTGKLHKDMIRKILSNLKQPFTEDQILELFYQAEFDENEYTDYKSFVKIMLDY